MKYYLKTNNEAEMWASLAEVGLARQEEGEWIFTGIALDMVGAIHKPTGQMLTDADGNEYPETAPIEGFHANLIADAGIEGLPTVEAPTTPHRTWAGA